MFKTSYSSFLILGIYLFSVGLVSCKKNTKSDRTQNPDDDTLIFDLSYNSLQLELDTQNFSSKVPQPILLTPSLEESSGIIASRINHNMYWLHEDSGSESEIYLYHQNGQRKQHYRINGIEARDYEDISYGFGPQNEPNYIYLGDIGDNNQSRSNIVIYRFPEPNYDQDSSLNQINNVEALTLTYPVKDNEIQSENAEAFFIDPVSGDLFMFSKSTTLCKVLTVEAPLPFGKETHLKHIGDLNFRHQKITGADISSDGQHILIKSYDYVYYWKRDAGQTIIDALQTIPVRLTYQAEPQGEAITWVPNRMSYVTISEFKSGILPGFRIYNL